MMSQVIHREVIQFFVSVCWGVIILLIYDLFRGFRRAIPHGIVWISLEDLLYWSWAGFATFLVIFQKNDGTLRGFFLAGMGMGMILYHETVSKGMVKGFFGLFWCLKKGILSICGFFQCFAGFFCKFFKKVCPKPLKNVEKRNRIKELVKQTERSKKRGVLYGKTEKKNQKKI